MEKGQPKKLGKEGKPSEANHGNIPPDIARGGFTITKATQTTVLSLTALRRLCFPMDGRADSAIEVDQAARTTLAAMGLAAAVLAREEGADLRSRCLLFPTEKFVWSLLDTPGETEKEYVLNGSEAVNLFKDALADAKAIGLPWDGEVPLTPTADLVELLAKSQELAMHQTAEEGN